jgi:Ca-activated chloride channel homolog
MKAEMNPRRILVLAVLALVACFMSAQTTSQQDLPSAPSAAKQESQPKAAPPAEPASPPKPKPKPPAVQELKTLEQQAAEQPSPSAPQASAANTEALQATSPGSQNPAASQNQGTAAPAPTAPAPNPPAKTPGTTPAADDTDESLTRIVKTVNEVNVVFTVTDKHGRYVKDLKKEDFRVLDDNKPARGIQSFHAETDLPLQVGLLVDASNSVRDRFKFEQEAAIEFLNQIVRPSYDRAFVVGFDTTPEVTQDFTDSTELLSKGVRSLRAGGGTAMYDALYFACRDKLKNAPRTGPVRRAIILLSDGEDNQSRVTREESIEMAQRAEVIVYTISTNISGQKRPGDKVLERIADATGGRAFFPFQLSDVSNAFTEIQDELRSQYALAYIPDDFHTDGRFRSIQILAAQNPKSLHVRSRRGYYAPTR